MNNHIGKKVKEFREALDISQGELGKRIGLTQQAISVLENQDTIDDDRLKAIWKALNPDFNLLKKFPNRIDNQQITIIDNQSGAVINQIESISGDYNNHPLEKLAEFADKRVEDIKQLLEKETKQIELIRAQYMETMPKLAKLEIYEKQIIELKEKLAKYENN